MNADKNEGEVDEKPILSDRMQYWVGALVSVVLVVGYVLLTSENESSEAAGTEAPVAAEAPAVVEDPVDVEGPAAPAEPAAPPPEPELPAAENHRE